MQIHQGGALGKIVNMRAYKYGKKSENGIYQYTHLAAFYFLHFVTPFGIDSLIVAQIEKLFKSKLKEETL